MNLYSQFGQDEWLAEHFDIQPGGYFVELGAWNGTWLSNTKMLEESFEWSGLLVEMQTDQAAWAARRRPRSRVVSCCLGAATGSLVQVNLDRKAGFVGRLGELVARKRPKPTVGAWMLTYSLRNLLRDCSAPPKLDVVSLDLDGAEEVALQGFSFGSYDVGVWFVEENPECWEVPVESILARHGYVAVERIGSDVAYTRQDVADEIAAGRRPKLPQ